jgi:hypothetical protein
MGGTRDLEENEQMGLLVEFPRKPGHGKHRRHVTTPLRAEQRTGRRVPRTACGHKLLSVVPIVSIRVEGGYAARCLLCGTTGPVRVNGEAARDVLLEQMVRDEE